MEKPKHLRSLIALAAMTGLFLAEGYAAPVQGLVNESLYPPPIRS